jgi:hypothetical protein
MYELDFGALQHVGIIGNIIIFYRPYMRQPNDSLHGPFVMLWLQT